MNRVGASDKWASPRVLQSVGVLVIGVAFTVLGTVLWNSHAGLDDSLASRLLAYLLLFTFGPGEFFGMGGNVHNDFNLRIAQIANLVIYTGLGYVFIRFLDWRRSKSRAKS